jgi:3-oxoacyl-[acyl-carrier protein] reductase
MTGERRKVALVTGASRGIGRACAAVLARAGFDLCLTARDGAALGRLASQLSQAGGTDVKAMPGDLKTPGFADELAEACGSVDVLVNNAGDTPAGSLLEIGEAAWRDAWELKVFGYINLTRAVLPGMFARRSGVVVNVVGMGGVRPTWAFACGATANAALIALTQALGGESPRFGVRVVGVNPSATNTHRMAALYGKLALDRLGDASRAPDLQADLPFGRLCEPDEVAGVVAFLASDAASYLSGMLIDVDGGARFKG